MSVTRQKYKDNNGRTKLVANYTIGFNDHHGVRQRFPGFEDKGLSEQLEQRLKKLAAMRIMGRSFSDDPEIVRWIEEIPERLIDKLRDWEMLPPLLYSRPVEELLDAWKEWHPRIAPRSWNRKGWPFYVLSKMQQVRRAFRECGFRTLADYDDDRFARWVESLPVSQVTKDKYTAVVHGFYLWITRTDSRIRSPIAQRMATGSYGARRLT